jgi:P-type Ca2+ transporter type 2C
MMNKDDAVSSRKTNSRVALPYWALTAKELLVNLGIETDNGLNEFQVNDFRFKFGSNSIEFIKLTSIGGLIIEGIRQPMMVLLLVIAVISILFGRTIEALVMIFVVMAYISVEFVNKYRSDRTMLHLKTLNTSYTSVVRKNL